MRNKANRRLGLWAAFAVATLISTAGVAVAQEEVVISDDGRQIQINGDGTWVQLSKDRYATNSAGQRLRLKPDGTWNVMADTERTQGTPLTRLSAANETTLFLEKVEILKRKIKRAKSIHAQSNTVYHLQVLNDTSDVIRLDVDLTGALTAGHSSGGRFPIERVSYDRAEIAPGERGQLTVVAEGAPQWFGVKYMTLEVAANALGNSNRRVLSKNMTEVVKREVEQL